MKAFVRRNSNGLHDVVDQSGNMLCEGDITNYDDAKIIAKEIEEENSIQSKD